MKRKIRKGMDLFMKKRIIAAILCGVMAITGITACSSQESTDSSSLSSQSVAVSSDEETSKEETSAEQTSKEETSAEQTSKEETSAEQTSKEETSAEQTSEEETSAEQTSEEETSVPDTDKPVSGDALEFAQKLMPGWNLGNQLEANLNKVPSETAWGNPVITEELIKAVKAQGFKSIRIPVSYLSKIGDGPDYTIDSAWLDRVAEVVDMCVDNGLYAVINIHGDGYYTVTGGWLLCAEPADKQKEIKAKYEKVWAQIAERFKGYDEHLIFESMNEVSDGNYNGPTEEYYNNINDYNQIFVDTVRASGGNNASRYLLVPGWNTDIDNTVEGSAFKLPNDSASRIMVSVHYYTPYEFCIKETAKGIFRWGNGVTTQSIRRNNEDYVDEEFDKLYDSFISKGIPVIIGEYGAIDKSYNDERSTTYRAYFAEYVNCAAADRDIVTMYWDNGHNGKNGFGIFDRSTYEVTQPEIIASIIKGSKGGYEIVAPTE